MDKKVLKKKAMEYKGGSCLLCDYSKYPGALDFHHINPFEKEFNISDYNVWDETLVKELDKCVLLCKICHALTHAGFVDIELFKILER